MYHFASKKLSSVSISTTLVAKVKLKLVFFFSLVAENSPPPQRDSYLQAECI